MFGVVLEVAEKLHLVKITERFQEVSDLLTEHFDHPVRRGPSEGVYELLQA